MQVRPLCLVPNRRCLGGAKAVSLTTHETPTRLRKADFGTAEQAGGAEEAPGSPLARHQFRRGGRLIEKKLEETKRQIFANLSAWDRVNLPGIPKRPFTLDYLELAFTGFSELHGDRLFAEDRALVGGFASLGGHKVMVIGTQKGRDTKENILRNFGSAHPEGYRKALRLMRLADKFRSADHHAD